MKLTTILLSLLVVLLPVFGKLAEGSCYRELPSGIFMLNRQIITGTDCFTGRFNPPQYIDYPPNDQSLFGFDFDTFRSLFLGMIGLLLIGIFLRIRNKHTAAAILSTGSFLTGVSCVAYFDAYHNYYALSAGEKFDDLNFTFDIVFKWLSDPIFWALFAAVLLLNWLPLFFKHERKRSVADTLDQSFGQK